MHSKFEKDIMRYLFPILFAFVTILPASAQNGEYDKILAMLVDEDYEKVLYKCEKRTLDDDTKKDPIPYLYMAMAYFEMSKRGEYEEDYPKAFKNSLKYASKHRRKDKEDQFFGEFSDFFSEIREVAMVNAEVEIDREKYMRAKGIYKYLIKIDESDVGAHLMMAYCNYMDNDSRDAEENLEMAKKVLEEKGIDHLANEQLELLKTGIINVADFMSNEGMSSEAKNWMETGKEYFEGDDKFMGYYREIVG